jgi:hypothetical protein
MPYSCANRLSSHESSEINLDGQIIPYTLKRSPRAKHARLEIRRETGLTVIVPQGYPRSLAGEIITDKKRWIKTKLELFDRGKQLYMRDCHGTRYLGRQLKVKMNLTDSSIDEATLTEDELVLCLKTVNNYRPGIETWLKNQAERIIKEMAEKHSLQIGVKFQALCIRSARTRWGSCSPHGALSFNWKLIIAPLPVIEYVVIHELCHLRELNHSKSFWKLVENHCPDWRVQRKWLRANEAALTL